MKNKIGWIIIFIELGVFFLVITKYWETISEQITFPVAIRIDTTEDKKEIENDEELEDIKEVPTITPTLTPKVKIVTPSTIKKTTTPSLEIDDDTPWGVAKQISETTWTMKLGEDEKMATPEEVWKALNDYRKNHDSQVLNWDNKLASYAQNRAAYLNSIKNVDEHKGFSDFVNNEDGFEKLGFTALGENISYGYKLNGVHIIEWMYAGDKPHNDNQLDNKWNYVGVGVDGLATCLIFGTGKF